MRICLLLQLLQPLLNYLGVLLRLFAQLGVSFLLLTLQYLILQKLLLELDLGLSFLLEFRGGLHGLHLLEYE